MRAHERLAPAHDAHEAPWAHLVTLAPRLEVGEAHAHSNAPIGGEEGAAQLLIGFIADCLAHSLSAAHEVVQV